MCYGGVGEDAGQRGGTYRFREEVASMSSSLATEDYISACILGESLDLKICEVLNFTVETKKASILTQCQRLLSQSDP